MQTTIPLYGFGGGSGGTGASLTVTAPAGATVTVSKEGKSKTKAADFSGVAVFKGLGTGAWTVTITDGEQTAQKTVTVTADYSTSIAFFAATIHVIYPSGSTCTATDGVTTLRSDTSGTWAFVVPNAGTWTIRVVDKGWEEAVEIAENGQSEQVYLDGLYLFKDGNSYESRTGGFAKTGYTYYGTSYTVIPPTIGDTITVEVSEANAACIAGTQKAIDVTNMNTLSADCVNVSTQLASLVITNSERNAYYTKVIARVGLSSGQTVTIDLSGVSGSVYIAVALAGSDATPSASAVVNNIKLT